MIESLLGPSSNRNQVTDVNDKSMTGTTLVVTIEMRTCESNELKQDPVRSDWSGSEIGGAVMK